MTMIKTTSFVAIAVMTVALFGAGIATMSMANADNAAMVIKEGGCIVLNGNGDLEAADSTRTHTVVTSSGVTKLTCKGTVTPADDGRAAVLTFDDVPILCGTVSGTTDDWRNVVSAKGKVTLQCFIKP